MEQENRDGCIPVGSYARLHIMEVPGAVASKLSMLGKTIPITACGLFEHESKVSLLHFRYFVLDHIPFFASVLCHELNIPSFSGLIWSFLNIQKMCHELKSLVLCSVKKHETYDAPIKSKEELIFHVGFRQFVGRYGIQFEQSWHLIYVFLKKY